MFDVVIVSSCAGGGIAAHMLTRAGAKVAIVEAGGHNVDRDIRHHQWPWEMRYRNVYQQDPVQVQLTTKRYVPGRGETDEVITFDGSAHRNYYNDHFFVKMSDWRYTWQENSPYRWVRVRSIGGKTHCWNAGALRWGPIEWKPYSYDGYGIDWLVSNGLANSSGQVGRNLVEDMAASVSGSIPKLEGRPMVNEDGYQGTMIHPFVNVDAKTRSKDFLRRYVMRFNGGFGMRGGGSAPFGEALKASARRTGGSGVSVTGAGGGLENPNNYVDVDPDVKDARGIPAARIHLKHGPNQEAMVRDMVSRGIELIEAAGGRVNSSSASPSVPGANIHEQGTCRMGDEPKKFVTNRWGRCRTSFWPTAPYTAPAASSNPRSRFSR